MACSKLSKAVLVLTVFVKSGRATNSFRRCRSPGAATCNYGKFLDLTQIRHQSGIIEYIIILYSDITGQRRDSYGPKLILS